MEKSLEALLGGRERTRLRKARENGFLDARCSLGSELVRRYGRWCWTMKVPLVWFERRSPYSRFGRVHLEMFTTANILTDRGQAAMRNFRPLRCPAAPARVSPHDACWEDVPLRDLNAMARSVYRAATRSGNCDVSQSGQVARTRRRTGKLIEIMTARVA